MPEDQAGSARIVARLLVGFAWLFGAMVAVRTVAVAPEDRIGWVVAAAVVTTAAAAFALRETTLATARPRRQATAVLVAAAAAAGPVLLLPVRWVGLLELVAATAAVALPRRGALPAWALILVVVAAGSGREDPAVAGIYVLGVLLLTVIVGVPVALLRARRRRDLARADLVRLAERQARRQRASVILERLALLAASAPTLAPEVLGARVRAVHEQVRSEALEVAPDPEGPVDPTGSVGAGTGGTRRAARLRRVLAGVRSGPAVLVLAGAPAALIPALYALGPADDPQGQGALELGLGALLLALWSLVVLPSRPQRVRVTATVALTAATAAGGVWFGDSWGAPLLLVVAAVLVVGSRPVRIAALAVAFAGFTVAPAVLETVRGAPPLEVVAEALYASPVLILSTVLAVLPELVAASAQAEELSRVVTEAGRRATVLAVVSQSHDLLGQSLAAAALHADLAAGVAARDRRPEHLRLAVDLVLRAEREAHALGDEPQLSLDAELESAAVLLRATGATVDVRRPAGAGSAVPSPSSSPSELAWVVREATTNVLRHSAARRVVLSLVEAPEGLTLVVENDGVVEDHGLEEDGGRTRAAPTVGAGLASMRERLAAAGGSVTLQQAGDRFVLRADLPTAQVLR